MARALREWGSAEGGICASGLQTGAKNRQGGGLVWGQWIQRLGDEWDSVKSVNKCRQLKNRGQKATRLGGEGCTACPNTSRWPTARSPISSEGNELLVQFVSDLSVTADGFSASYRTGPRGTAEKGPAPSPGKDTRPGPPPLGPGPKSGAGPKVKPPTKPKLQPGEKPEASPEAQATPLGPGESRKGEGEHVD